MANYTFYVTVSGGKFLIDGVSQQTVDLGHNLTYRFDQSDSSNGSGSGHPLRFSTTSDGTWGGGSALGSGDGVTTNGTPGQSGAYTEIAVTSSTTNPLYYYCSNHSGMGGQANTTSAEFANTTGVALKKPILANATDKWGQFSNQNLDTIAGKLPQSFVFPTGTGNNNQVILSNGSGGTSWGDVALTPEITGLTWYSDSGYSSALSASEAINIDDATYLKITGQNFGSSGVFGSTAYVQIINTTQSNAVVGNNQSGLTGCVTSASYQSEAEVRFTINPSGVSGISSGDTLKVKFVTGGGESLFATGYVVSADPTSVTTVNSATISNTASVGSVGGVVAGGGEDSNTKLLLNFDRTDGTDIEDSSNVGGDGYKVTATNAVIKSSPFGDGKSAMFFDGTDDYLTVADSSDFDFGVANAGSSSAWTMECWFKETVSITDGAMLFYWSTDGNHADNFFQLYYVNATPKMYFNCKMPGSSTTLNIVSDTTLEINKWYHVALVCNGSGGISMYLNGNLEGTSVTNYNGDINFSSTSSGSAGLVIGARKYSSTINYYMGGYIDEIRIVKGTPVYTGEFDVPTSRLSATQSNQGTNIADITGTATKLLIHSNQSGDGVFLGDPVQKSHSITMSPSNLIQSYYIADSSYTQYQHLTKEYLINGVRENGLYVSQGASANTGDYIRFDCGSGKSVVANGILWAQDRNAVHGTFQVQGSNDATSWTTLTSSDITIGTSSGSVYEYSYYFTNTNAYRYYQIIGTGGNWSQGGGPWITEIALLNNAFTDSSDSGHNISATGSYHSQGHGGIAPAMTFPASLKKTGSAGINLNGSGQYLTIHDFSVGASSPFTFECWFYNPSNSAGHLYDWRPSDGSANGNWIQLSATSFSFRNIQGNNNSAISYTPDQWNHIAYTRDGSGNWYFYLNGKKMVNGNGDTGALSSRDIYFGRHYSSGTSENLENAYIDGIKFSTAQEYSGTGTTDWSNFDQPTKIYGAFKSDTIDTITLTGTAGTGGGYVTFNNATLSGNTETTSALPAGLSLNEAESTDNTATITGDLTADAGNHAINLVARATSDGTNANIDPNRKQAYSHTITKASGGAPVLFNARRYMGNETARDINGLGLKPDLVWIKNRDNNSHYHQLFDSVRGATNRIYSNDATNQGTDSQTLTAFNSDGFSIGTNIGINGDDEAHIAWAWKAGGAPTATNDNTTGAMDANSVSVNGALQASYTPSGSPSIYPKKMSVNTAGGFSIIQYTKNGTAGATLPHGLSQAPELIIVKDLGSSNNWIVYHTSLGATKYLILDDNTTGGTNVNRWNNTAPSNSVVTLGSSGHVNGPGGPDYIMYCWHSVSGVSEFGTYEGNGQASGTTRTINLQDSNFTPRLLIIKNIDDTGHWIFVDAFRSGYSTTKMLYANDTTQDVDSDSASKITIGATGSFNLTGGWGHMNASDETYIYMAFA